MMDCDASVTSGQADDSTPKEESCRPTPLPIAQVRQELREYVETITRVDDSLATLKTELIALREQDLFLLKQLIHVGDSIRKLSRSRHGGRRKTHKANKELMTTAADLSVTLRSFRGRSGSLFAGDASAVPLIRRQSEPQVCLLGPPCDVIGDVRSWDSRRGSGSSAGWWGSEDTLGSSQDELDTFGSDDDILNDSTVSCFTTIDTTPTSAANSTTNSTDTITPTATTSTIDVPNYSATLPNLRSRRLQEETVEQETPTTAAAAAGAAAADIWHRPKSHSVIAATFLSSGSSRLSCKNSAYSDILTNNVCLWKNRLQSAQSVRQKVAVLEEEES